MAGNLLAIVDHVVTELQAEAGHARVYNRQRSTRNRQEFAQLFVGSGLDFWTARRTSSVETHRGASHQATRTHQIRCEGTMAAEDQDDAANSREVQMQQLVESFVERLRNDPTLGGTVEHAQPVDAGMEDASVAGVACYVGYIIVEAREALSW